MTTAVGLRDQRLRLYRRANQGSDGYVEDAFVFTGEWWGRLDETRAAVSQSQERLRQTLDATADLSDEATVPENGILLDTTDGRAWWIRGIDGNRLMRIVTLGLDRVSDEQFRTLKFLDGDVGAVPLVNPS